MQNILQDKEFQRLEKLYPYLSRAREHIAQLEKEKYEIVDVETTGLDPVQNEIIEIGALKVEEGEVKDVFNTLICPSAEISSRIEQLTGINKEMVSGHPTIKDIAPQFLSFMGNNIIVAHNTDFDIPFLKHHLGKKFDNMLVCTLKLSKKYLPNLSNHKLHTLAAYYGINAQNQHRALGDVETTYQIWTKMIPFLRDKGIYSKEDLQKV